MSFDLQPLSDAVAAHGRVTRVVVAEVAGSAPREVGAAMLVWQNGQSGTIGGGALELEAAMRARRALSKGDWLQRVPLGPGLGQCCGGAVTLLGEVWDGARLDALDGPVVLRRVEGDHELPMRMQAQLKQARNSGQPVAPRLLSGWMIEPVTQPDRHIWIYGAGHVGRAIVAVLAPMPGLAISWVDSSAERFPPEMAENVTPLVAQNPADCVKFAPADAEHLVLTYSHALDLEICHRLLQHGFRSAGLIGSKTKWARFRRKLAGLGHSGSLISRINCPIGRPELGKHPHAIAVGVAGSLLSTAVALNTSEKTGGAAR